ncbi:MAG: hypothetical protein FJ308_14485 [Planctomycetes bacterium]|nr:hypothetical protein [Planctomycetota bacterium]
MSSKRKLFVGRSRSAEFQKKGIRYRKLAQGFEHLEFRRLMAADLSWSTRPIVGEYIPNEILVQYLPGANVSQRGMARASTNGSLSEQIFTKTMQASGLGQMERVSLGNGVTVPQALAALANNPFVAYAEPNYIYKPAFVSNDTYYSNGSLWGMYGDDSPAAVGPVGTTNAFGSQAEKAWNDNIVGKSSVVVGIIDEGVQTTHPDLVNNIWVNPFETPNDGIDNDGNGYVDDVNGWDFVNNDKTVYDAGGDSHGTHVAGTIGGDGGNGAGVVGVNWDVTMISTKFLGTNGGSTANAVKALDYLTDLKSRHGINIVATNNSWGGGGYSQSLHDAIIRSAKSNILFVAAAGNSTTNNDTTASYPSNYNTTVGTSTQTAASYDSVIAVAAISNTGAIASFSSFGATTVDIGAPGVSINSSVPTNTYASYNGTSMATPHVTGAVALYASVQPAGVSASSIKTAILNSATPTASLAGKTLTGGRLNVYAALQQASSIVLDKSVYGAPSTASVTVTYAAANSSSSLADTLQITVQSSSELTPESITLTETGINTGVFSGSFGLLTSSAAGDGSLAVSNGDTITATCTAISKSTNATVDLLAPTLTNITASPQRLTSRIDWNTNESSTTVVLFGTSSNNLDQSNINTTLSTAHSATLSGLQPGTTYYYQVQSTDAAGNTSTSSVLSFVTSAPAAILFVDDDLGAAYDVYFKNALTANGLDFDVWDSSTVGNTPASTQLAAYQTVIWNTGYDYSTSTATLAAGLSASEQTQIAAYLNGGGRMLVSGQDILYNFGSDANAASFRQNYLKVSTFTNDVINANHTENGVAGNPITNGMSLAIAKPVDYPSLYVDALTPAPGATGLLTHGLTTTTNPFTAVSYRGDYASGGFGVVFLAVPFESISTSAASPNNQAVFLKRVLDFLAGTAGVSISPPSATATTEAGGTVTVQVSLLAQPTSDVTVPVSSNDVTEGSVNVSSITFTPSNWNIPQTVTVTGIDDNIDDGNIAYSILFGSTSSTDSRYNGIDPADSSLTNTDNDTAGITVSALTSTTTSESGASTSFTIKLNSEPTANVTVAVNSSDTTEGTVSQSQIVFSAANWNQPVTITVTGVDDTILDGNIAYTVAIAASTSTDTLYNGINPADFSVTNLDNDVEPPTKFFVVDDGNPDRNYHYDSNGAAIKNYAINSGNTAPRGIATTSAGTKLWIVDNNKKVYVYTNTGTLLGSWTAGTLASNATVEGLATDGTNIWIVDSRADRVYYYANAAALTSGTATATSFALATGNTNPKDVVFGVTNNIRYLWVVNDAATDTVFRYALGANGLVTGSATSWTLNSANSRPTGITVDPSNATQDIWVVDSGKDRVYKYANGRSGAATLTSSFALTTGNTNPQGIADPPPAWAAGWVNEGSSSATLSAISTPLPTPPGTVSLNSVSPQFPRNAESHFESALNRDSIDPRMHSIRFHTRLALSEAPTPRVLTYSMDKVESSKTTGLRNHVKRGHLADLAIADLVKTGGFER